MRKVRTLAWVIVTMGVWGMGTMSSAQESQYRGFPVSLNLKDADIVTVLHVLAEEAGLNLVVGEDVKGRIDVHLVDVPWDQALEEILRNKGLVKRQVGNVLHVLTTDGLKRELERKELLRAEEAKELEAKQKAKEILSRIQQEEEMAKPLETRTFFIRYAKAAELQKNLQPHLSRDSKGQPRGSIEVNEFANVLVVRDIQPVLEDMEELLRRLDRPTPQVLIEARIVEVNTEAVKDLGIQWGGEYREENTSRGTVTAIGGARGVSPDPTSTGNITEIATRGFAVNLPASDPVLGLGITLGRIVEGLILDIQLTALERAGRAHVLSRPKIVTMDNQEAVIKRGEDIPYVLRRQYNEVPDVQFKEAKLQLKVRPHVIGEDRLSVEVSINNDARTGDVVVSEGSVFPIIARQEAQTRALIRDGDTMVLGGIIRQERRKRERGVPFLKDLPVLSWLFRSDFKSEDSKELLIFITPRILREEGA